MLGVLRFIADGIALIGQMVAWALVTVINLLIAAVGGLIQVLMDLLPDLPAAPTVDSSVLGLFAWLMPLGSMAAVFVTLLAAWGLFLVIRIALNWVKAL